MLTINNANKYSAVSAVIEGYLIPNSPAIKWGIEVQYAEVDRVSPLFTIESLIVTDGLSRVRDIRDLCTRIARVDVGKVEPRLYTYYHSILFCDDLLLELINFESIVLSFKGRSSDGNSSSTSNYDHTITVQEKLNFSGIWCGKRDEHEARTMLSDLIDISSLTYQSVRNGVAFFSAIP